MNKWVLTGLCGVAGCLLVDGVMLHDWPSAIGTLVVAGGAAFTIWYFKRPKA